MLTELSPGALLGRRYRLDALLGEGGMGAVWAATHTVTRHRVALKLLKSRSSQRQDHRRRFWREARAASAVQHPNVVRIHDLFELEDETLIMVMDLLEGQTLGQKLRAQSQLSIEETASYLVPAVSAVGTAHALGIVHRDLKPDNIFLAEAGGSTEVRVLDFGIAKLTGAEDATALADTITNTGAMLGTPYYMSPEQGLGERDVDHRTDIWSLGVILFEALAGARPVEGENLGQVIKRLMSEAIVPLEAVVPDLPAEISDLVRRMLSRERNNRPQDLKEVQAVLERHTAVRAPAFGPPAREATAESDESVPGRVQVVVNPSWGDPGRPTASANLAANTGDPTTSSIPPRRQTAKVALFGAGIVLAGSALWGLWAISQGSSDLRRPVPATSAGTREEVVQTKPANAPSHSPTSVAAAAPVATATAASAAPASSVRVRLGKTGSAKTPASAASVSKSTNVKPTPIAEPAKPGPTPVKDGLVDDPPF